MGDLRTVSLSTSMASSHIYISHRGHASLSEHIIDCKLRYLASPSPHLPLSVSKLQSLVKFIAAILIFEFEVRELKISITRARSIVAMQMINDPRSRVSCNSDGAEGNS